MAESKARRLELDPEEIKARGAKKRAVASSGLPDKIHTWPYLVKVEFIAAIIMIAFLIVWSLVVDAPMEQAANPALTPNPSKAPWYFLGLQELLVYFDPWIAGVVLPSLIVSGLMIIPYVDVNPKGNGYYTIKERPFALLVFLFGFFVLWMMPIVIGVFFRGPGWNLFWPWEYWDPHRVVEMTNIDFPYLIGARTEIAQFMVGAVAVGAWFVVTIPAPWALFRKSSFFSRLGLARWLVVGVHLSIMLGVVAKMVLRLVFSVKYVWVTPWFNI